MKRERSCSASSRTSRISSRCGSSTGRATTSRRRKRSSRPRPTPRTPPERLPERVAKAMADAASPEPSAVELQNLRTVWDAGIPVAMGTDAGNIGTLHGPSVFRELGLMVQAGLTPLQVLRAATVNGARAMGLERELGTLAPGKLADLLILDADPLADVQNLAR